VPISISGDPSSGGQIEHTVRDVGGVTHALVHAVPGSILGVRGPFGSSWRPEDGEGGDLVIVAGGIGLAPLRPALLAALTARDRYSRIVLLYGTRSPDDVVFSGQLRDWADRGVQVEVIVDYGPPSWTGRVGLVTQLVPRAGFDPHRSLALVCGPEVMMRYAATALLDRGVLADRVRVSLERNMKCGVGLCGHCQLRELFVCTDGPVFDFPKVADLLTMREL
jgi:NAD(P)H-flavin reductase